MLRCRRPTIPVLVVALAGLVAACRDDGRELPPARPDQTASVSTSSAPPTTDAEFVEPTTGPTATLPGGTAGIEVVAPWRDGAVIDDRYSCTGDNVSPALSWGAGPANAAEVAISMLDDDAPGFVHWVIAGIDPAAGRIGEGEVPPGAVQSTNSAGQVGYFGPCPPPGAPHTYRITVHFLDQQLEIGEGAAAADLLAAVEAATMAAGQVTGIFSRG